jgi:hypothetical protein
MQPTDNRMSNFVGAMQEVQAGIDFVTLVPLVAKHFLVPSAYDT